MLGKHICQLLVHVCLPGHRICLAELLEPRASLLGQSPTGSRWGGGTLLQQSRLYHLQAHFKCLLDSSEQFELTVPVLFQVFRFLVLCPLRQRSQSVSLLGPIPVLTTATILFSGQTSSFCSMIDSLLCLTDCEVSSLYILGFSGSSDCCSYSFSMHKITLPSLLGFYPGVSGWALY